MKQFKIDLADQAFSLYVRTRDEWTCQRCGRYFPPDDDGGRRGRMALHCSHFFRRGIHATRFEPDNCVAFCYPCHQFYEYRRADYTDFMRSYLGEARYGRLVEISLREARPVYQKQKDMLVDYFTKKTKELENRNEPK